jgi:hypothetical protein
VATGEFCSIFFLFGFFLSLCVALYVICLTNKLVHIVSRIERRNGKLQIVTATAMKRVFGGHLPTVVVGVLLQRNDTSLFRKYTRSIFRAVSHQYSVSYGAQPPERIGETWVVNVSMLFGSIMFAVFLASVVQVISTIDTAGNKYDEMVYQLFRLVNFGLKVLDF